MMMLDSFRKPLQYGLSILIAATLLFVGIRVYHLQNRSSHPAVSPAVKSSVRAPSQMDIKGFHYTANQDGHAGLSIRADRMVVKKKKVGMLRFGLLKEVHFANARIEINARTSTQPDADIKSKRPAPMEASLFADAFKLESLAAIPMKKVAGIHFSPIDLRLNVDGRRKVWVRANSASVKMPSGDVAFKGNVRWHTGQTIIKSAYVIASLEKNTLLVPEKYALNRGSKIIRGSNLRSDLLLNRIAAPHPAASAKIKTNQGYRKADIKNRENKTYAEHR
jgi:hypothetical protein